MVISSGSERSDSEQKEPSSHQTYIRFYILAVLFNLCLVAQVLTVGLAYFYNAEWWNPHVWLVRGYSGLSLILAIWAYFSSLPRRVRSLASSLPVLLGLQFSSIHLKTPFHLEVLHPLIGFTLLSVSSSLVHRVWRILSPANHQNDQF
jgi:Family of unknown function (DUF6220)